MLVYVPAAQPPTVSFGPGFMIQTRPPTQFAVVA